MVTCDVTDVLHPETDRCENPADDRTRSRRAVILTRALHHPDGLTPYEFTKGMTKDDSLQFWNDAKALGMVGVGQSKRGARKFALPSYKVPA